MLRRYRNLGGDSDPAYVLQSFAGECYGQQIEHLRSGGLHPVMRAIAYLRASGLLGNNSRQWAEQLRAARSRFIQRQTAYDDKIGGARSHDPLEGTAQERHKLLLQEQQILKDIARLFSGSQYFSRTDVREVINHATALFCFDVEYRQGIHEIVGFCWKMAEECADSIENMQQLLQQKQFNYLIYFQDKEFITDQFINFFYNKVGLVQAFQDDKAQQQLSVTIQAVDQALSAHFQKTNVELFCAQRMLALLFCREVDESLVPRLWDWFAATAWASNGLNYQVILRFGAILIRQKRQELLASDFYGCMRVLGNPLADNFRVRDMQRFLDENQNEIIGEFDGQEDITNVDAYQGTNNNSLDELHPENKNNSMNQSFQGLSVENLNQSVINHEQIEQQYTQLDNTQLKLICSMLTEQLQDCRTLIEQGDARGAVRLIDETLSALTLGGTALLQEAAAVAGPGADEPAIDPVTVLASAIKGLLSKSVKE